MQGFHEFIPTDDKAAYISTLLKVGFDVIDFGSFVSPKAIPQMRDTDAVLNKLDLSGSSSKLLAITANIKGAEAAVSFPQISYLGYPHALSPEFLRRNIHSDPQKSLMNMDAILNLCFIKNKELKVYVSMGFGNPYGEEWNTDLLEACVEELSRLGVRYIVLSDTIGTATTEKLKQVLSLIPPRFAHIRFGLHLHVKRENQKELTSVALNYGNTDFEGVMFGKGGCPLTGYEMLGNFDNYSFIQYLTESEIDAGIHTDVIPLVNEWNNKIFNNLS
jgi:hydroxymethylglutaryl-CoA lyase